MFHVEQSMKNVIFALFILCSLAACNKRDPNPEKKDQLYLAIEAEINAKNSEKTQIEVELNKAKQIFKDSEPQTGQIKTTRKKVYDWEYALNRIQQEIRYLELRKQARFIDIQKRYLRSFAKGEALDTSEEFTHYVYYNKRRQRPRDWRVEERIKEVGLWRKPTAAGGDGKKNDKAPPKEH